MKHDLLVFVEIEYLNSVALINGFEIELSKLVN